ncbi:MarR family transcriptional regulator [Donghicola sp. C2-DW-16]|uniref:MarR family transcriptional regulator n=1 Tax=Donghicola mangrovi TaxID=2729614 RepID=A0ABX2PHF8_9RHOB|nr:MarR family transcriptional regulator [Donghicola mangrovi]NVO28625.1 MarR family transcriptional regulator [Donghicola mangrovi]
MARVARKQAVAEAIPSDRSLRQFIGYSMKQNYLLIREDMIRTIEPLGLRVATFSALAIINENPDITQTQLAQALRIERSGTVVIVDELENADLIGRNRVEGDRRSYALRATLAGQKLWKKAEAAVQAHERALLSALSEEEQTALYDMLRRIGTAGSSD